MGREIAPGGEEIGGFIHENEGGERDRAGGRRDRGGKEDRTSVGLKTSHESEMVAAVDLDGNATGGTVDFGRRTETATRTRGWISC